MKLVYLTLLSAVLALIAGCGATDSAVTVSGGVDVNANVSRSEMTQRNGILYIRSTDSVTPYCMSVDPSATYPDVWVTLEDADSKRQTAYTNEELAVCGY